MGRKYSRFDYVRYTCEHRKAFREVERELTGGVSLRGYLHDLDKVILYPILGKKLTSKIHVNSRRHHKKARCEKDYLEQLIDWQCAGRTKENKPLNAYQTMKKFHRNKEGVYTHLMMKYGLINRNKEMLNADGTYTPISEDKVKIFIPNLKDWLEVYIHDINTVRHFLSKPLGGFDFEDKNVEEILKEMKVNKLGNKSNIFRLCTDYILIGVTEISAIVYLTDINNTEFIADLVKRLLKDYPCLTVEGPLGLCTGALEDELKEYMIINNPKGIEIR